MVVVEVALFIEPVLNGVFLHMGDLVVHQNDEVIAFRVAVVAINH